MFTDNKIIYCDFEKDDHCPISTLSTFCPENLQLNSGSTNGIGLYDASLNACE